MKFYSPTTRGFYTSEINKTIPDDAIEISDIEHKQLFDAQSTGKEITFDAVKKRVIAVDRTPPTLQERRGRVKLSARDFKLKLLRMGLISRMRQELPNLSDEWQIAWEAAGFLNRMDPDLLDAAAQLGLTEAQLDVIFGLTPSLGGGNVE